MTTNQRRDTGTVTTGRPLDGDGEPIDRGGLELDPAGPAADLLRESVGPFVSSPGAGTWATLLRRDASSPELLQWLAPDATEPPTHRHPRPETFEAVEGALTVLLDGKSRRLTPGESVTVPPGTEHSFRNDTDETVAFRATLSSARTVDGLFTIWALDHEGAYSDDGYGEPGLLHALVIGDALYDDTTMTDAPLLLQRLLWSTVGRVARALGYSGLEERFTTREFWEATVEQPEL